MQRDRLACTNCRAACEKENVIGRGNLGTSTKPLCQKCYFNSSSCLEGAQEAPENVCPTHLRADKTYCLTCDALLCSSCVLHSNHRAHQILAREKVDLIAEKKACLLAAEIESMAQEGNRRQELWADIKKTLAASCDAMMAEVDQMSVAENGFVHLRIKELQAVLASCGRRETPPRFIRSLESLPKVYTEDWLILSYINLKSPIEEEVGQLVRDFYDRVALSSAQAIRRVSSAFKDILQEMYLSVHMHQAGNCKILDVTATSSERVTDGLDDCLASLNLEPKSREPADPQKPAHPSPAADLQARRSNSEKPILCSIIKGSSTHIEGSSKTFVFGKPSPSLTSLTRAARPSTHHQAVGASMSRDRPPPKSDLIERSAEKSRQMSRAESTSNAAAAQELPSQAAIARIFGSLMNNPDRLKIPVHLKAAFKTVENCASSVNLCGRNLTDLDMAYLLPFIKQNKHLSGLQVSKNRLTDRSLGLFAAAFKDCKKVQIAVDGNQMSQAGISKMRISFPTQIEIL